MITAAEIASIQKDVAAIALDKTCEIQRKTSSRDPYGSEGDTYSTLSTTMAGLAEPTAGELQNYDYLIADKAAWTVKLPIGTDVMVYDHLIIDGQTLKVHVVLEPKSYAMLLSVIAAELK
jgi:hypothetical protein